MVHKLKKEKFDDVDRKQIAELEKKGIFTFVSTFDRDGAVPRLENEGLFVEPLGDTMLVASKDFGYVQRVKNLEQMVGQALGRMTSTGQVKKIGKYYSMV